MGLPTMAFSASFDVGGLVTYWIIEYRRTGFHVSGAGVAWLTLGALVFIISSTIHLGSRRPYETSDQAISRQTLAAARKLIPVHEDA
jgi:hypothetical protein